MKHECVFCRIVQGEIPATRVYEDEHTLAFLDIGPLVKGHTLVIPKRHIDLLMDTPEEVLARLMAVVRRVARAQTHGLRADGVNVLQSNGKVAGQVVPHVHFHVIPRFEGDGHSWNWNTQSYVDPAEVRNVADKIRASLDL